MAGEKVDFTFQDTVKRWQPLLRATKVRHAACGAGALGASDRTITEARINAASVWRYGVVGARIATREGTVLRRGF